MRPLSSRHLLPSSIASFILHFNTCNTLLDRCLAASSFAGGRAIHAHLVKTGVFSLRPLPSKLLSLYSKLGLPQDYLAMFRESSRFDPFSWNTAISACFSNGDPDAAHHLFDEMPRRNHVSWSLIIDGFMKFGRVSEALGFLQRCSSPTVVSWTAAISGLARNGRPRWALLLLPDMLGAGVVPNEITFTSVIQASISSGEFDLGRSIIGSIVKTGCLRFVAVCNCLITFFTKMREFLSARWIFDWMPTKDVVSWTAMLDVYMEEGDLKSARKLFDRMPDKNAVSWSAMVARYKQSGEAMEALRLFQSMLQHGFCPSSSSLSPAICAAGAIEDPSLGCTLHGLSTKLSSSCCSSFVSSALISMYCSLELPNKARLVFDFAGKGKNAVCWNAMISGYCKTGCFSQALELFELTPQRNRASWNGMIAGLVAGEAYQEAAEFFIKMLASGETPCSETFSSILCACAGSSELDTGKSIHGWIIKLGLEDDLFIGTAMIDMYAKSSDISSSKRVFFLLKERNEASWSASINGLATNGLAQEAVLLFQQIKEPTLNLFLVALSACAHGGLVEQGIDCFRAMTELGLTPQEKHYGCLVDLLARAGLLRVAEKVAKVKGGVSAWAALLSGCRWRGLEEVAERAATRLREVEEVDPRSYVLLSNLYAFLGRWGDAERVRALMGSARVRKSRGYSWVVGRGRSCRFFCGQVLHKNLPEIYETLELIKLEMRSSLGHGESAA
ncbi:pentatricopeptide repeat-containing protein At1g31430-like [Wolffia australiana]